MISRPNTEYAGFKIIGQRDRQEDSFGYKKVSDGSNGSNFLAGVIADGIGGLANGDKASELVVNAFLGYVQTSDKGDIEDKLESAPIVVNHAVKRLFRGSDIGGSTMLGFCISEKTLYWVSVGDSLLYLFRDGVLIRLNEDQSMRSFLEAEVLAGEISLQEAMSDPRRNALFSYIGGDYIASVNNELAGFRLESQDAVIAATDGLLDLAESGRLEHYLNKHPFISAHRLCNGILEEVEALGKEHQDNATVMLVKGF